jgi:hypothetical protein
LSYTNTLGRREVGGTNKQTQEEACECDPSEPEARTETTRRTKKLVAKLRRIEADEIEFGRHYDLAPNSDPESRPVDKRAPR